MSVSNIGTGSPNAQWKNGGDVTVFQRKKSIQAFKYKRKFNAFAVTSFHFILVGVGVFPRSTLVIQFPFLGD